MRTRSTIFALLAATFLSFAGGCSRAGEPARLEAVTIAGEKLRGNPLHDRVERRVAVFVPREYEAAKPLPIVYYLPGYGGSSENFLRGGGGDFAQLVQKLADDGMPMLLAVVDCRNRWGGSQYLNSTAQGNYADYLCDEIVPTIEGRFAVKKERGSRTIAGHSSGGYGALMLAIAKHELFGKIVALSPDSEFDFTHRPLVEESVVKRVTPAELESYVAPTGAVQPREGLVELMLGLSAAYAPSGADKPGRFEWLYDASGKFREEVWQRWLEKDPLLIARKNPNAFSREQRVYLDGAERDAFRANVGARHIAEVLRERGVPCEFFESPGGHSDYLTPRLERGLRWVCERPVK